MSPDDDGQEPVGGSCADGEELPAPSRATTEMCTRFRRRGRSGRR